MRCPEKEAQNQKAKLLKDHQNNATRETSLTKKLLKLFQTEVVDLGYLSAPAIHKVIKKYYPERPYTSFGPLYKRNLCIFNISKLETGQRRGKFVSLCVFYNSTISPNS